MCQFLGQNNNEHDLIRITNNDFIFIKGLHSLLNHTHTHTHPSTRQPPTSIDRQTESGLQLGAMLCPMSIRKVGGRQKEMLTRTTFAAFQLNSFAHSDRLILSSASKIPLPLSTIDVYLSVCRSNCLCRSAESVVNCAQSRGKKGRGALHRKLLPLNGTLRGGGEIHSREIICTL